MSDRLRERRGLEKYGWEKVTRTGAVDPWSQPDMKLRETLYDPSVNIPQVLTLQQAREIVGGGGPADDMKRDSELRQIINKMGHFEPINGGPTGRGATEWRYNPPDLFEREEEMGGALSNERKWYSIYRRPKKEGREAPKYEVVLEKKNGEYRRRW